MEQPTSSSQSSPRVRKIFVVDDHPLVRQGLAQFINQEEDLEICGEASNGYEALEAIGETNPDLVIADLEMEGLNGLELTQQIKDQYPNLRVMMLSMHDEDLYAARAIRGGAFGYVMKEEDPERVVVAIRKVLDGEVALSPKASADILTKIAGKEKSSSIEQAQ